MELNIPDMLSDLLHEIGEIGGKHVYLVGGSVRDLILKRKTIDIDIVVEGDALRIAQVLQNRWDGKLKTYPEFGTATVTRSDPILPKVDFATARSETYHIPGTLPKVEPNTINADLLRRDFSINALAMCLDKDAFGSIIDKTGGLGDLRSGTIRVLHNKSYTDDPTRIFRAFRYAARYNFNIAETDIRLIQKAIPQIRFLSGDRIRNEIEQIFHEDCVSTIIQQLFEWNVLKTIIPGWFISPTFSKDYRASQNAISWASQNLSDIDFQTNIVQWMALFGLSNTWVMPKYLIEAICFRLVLDHQLRKIASIPSLTEQGPDSRKQIIKAFEKLDIPLSNKVSFDYQNGKWCIVDYENRVTYVYGDGNLCKVHTPLTTYRQLIQVLRSLTNSTPSSKIYQLLKQIPVEALTLGYLDTNKSALKREIIEDYLINLRNKKPIVTGNDLIQWGEKPGKNFQTILWELFAAQLDGKISTKSEGYAHFSSIINHTNKQSKK